MANWQLPRNIETIETIETGRNWIDSIETNGATLCEIIRPIVWHHIQGDLSCAGALNMEIHVQTHRNRSKPAATKSAGQTLRRIASFCCRRARIFEGIVNWFASQLKFKVMH